MDSGLVSLHVKGPLAGELFAILGIGYSVSKAPTVKALETQKIKKHN